VASLGYVGVKVVASVVVRFWSPAPWDGPSAESSLVGLLLGGISRVFVEPASMIGTNVGTY
jgi:hypothetical protein